MITLTHVKPSAWACWVTARPYIHATLYWTPCYQCRMSLLGYSQPSQLAPVPANVRCYSNSDRIFSAAK